MNSKSRLDTLEVSRDKLKLLEYLLAEEGIGNSEAKRIEPRGDVRNIPLSFAQLRLWFLDQMGSDRAVYNISEAYRLVGPLNLPAFQCAINEIICRHEVLRTTFRIHDGQPCQVVSREQPLELLVTDLSKTPDPERQATIHRLAAENAEHPFDLTQGPLLRIALLRLNEKEHVLLLCMHHIVSDGWSMNLLFRELALLYEAFCTGKPSPLAALQIQYADFAIWQRDWLRDDVLQRQLDYWKKQLLDLTPELALPTDRPRQAIQTHRGANHSFPIPVLLTEQLNAFCQSEGVTLFMLLLAAFKVLLYRHSGQTDIVIGSPIAGRTHTETEELIGCFVNTLVLRSNLSGNPSFRELLAQVRQTALDAYAHQDLPFERLVEELNPERSLSHSPLFQIMFALEDLSEDSLRLADLTVAALVPDDDKEPFDLTCSIVESEEELKVSIVFNSDLFEAATVTQLGVRFRTLLGSIVEDPSQKIAALDLISDAERKQLREWNVTRREYPRDLCLLELFETQVKCRPGALAVVCEDRQLRFQDLNHRANQLAHRLKSLGVGPDILVGIYMERSLDAVVGLLAVLKAGGAYVPLDPAYPDERLRFVLEDANIPVVLTQERLLSRLAGDRSKIMALDSEWESIAQESGENPRSLVTPDHLAYVIYTSGSTGKPKGVMIPQVAFLNYVVTSSRDYELGPDDRVLQFASLSFDASVEEIFSCLASGSRLVLRTDWMLESAAVFLRRCEDWGITVLSLPTAYWHELTAALEAETLRIPESLRIVVIGGERALADRLSLWQKHVPQRVRLINSYGPTETTVGATATDLPRTPTTDVPHEVPIGRPIPNAQAYVLDQIGQLVPIGVPGELYIGGIGLARGYLSRPDLTAERFVPDPFGGHAGARLYRTGDVARWRANGELEYLGRKDDQVKLRGFRIELGEIEAALGRHESVEQAVVVCREDSGEKRLVAYLTVRKRETTDAELRNSLKSQVPEYMVPAVFVRLDKLPLTANGKVDRRALPEPTVSQGRGKDDYCPPRDRLEQQLTKIWESLLQVERVSVKDNFFDLGGHSLLAVKLLAHINQSLGRNLPVVSVFQAPTVEQMAQLLRQQGWKPLGESLVVVQPSGDKIPFFCVHGYAGYTGLAAHLGQDQPVYGLVQGLDGNRFYTRVEDLAAHYLRDVKAICPKGPYLLGGHSFGGLVAFEMAQQLRRAGEEVGLLALIDPTPPRHGDRQFRSAVRSSKRRTRSVEKLGSRILRHLEQLREVPSGRKAAYIQERLSLMLTLLGKNGKRIRCEMYLRLGQPMPPELRTFYIGEILFVDHYPAASRAYRSQRYDGCAVLIDTGSDSELTWKELIPGRLITYTVPGEHLEILKEPLIGVVSGHLRNCLDQAQQARLATK